MLAHELSKNGYATALFGKWHLGYDPKFNPFHQGFGEFIGFVSGNVDYFAHVDQTYADMIQEMDRGVGGIIAALDKHGLTERTLIVFCSDNGANKNGDNGILRGRKGSIHEGGHRVPMIARWPGVIPAGKVSDATVLGMDLFPTILQTAGMKLPGNLDGVSILPLLRAEAELKERTVFWGVGKSTAARRGLWKLVIEKGAENENGSLYHLGDDPAEKKPATNPMIQQQLRDELDAWLKSWANVPQHS